MAEHEVNHACGHDRVYQLVGNSADRERKIAWLGGRDCPECQCAAGPLVNLIVEPGDKPRIVVALTRGTFLHKDELKARGYRFHPDFIMPDAGTPGLAVWARTFGAADPAKVEVEWAVARGWEVKAHGGHLGIEAAAEATEDENGVFAEDVDPKVLVTRGNPAPPQFQVAQHIGQHPFRDGEGVEPDLAQRDHSRRERAGERKGLNLDCPNSHDTGREGNAIRSSFGTAVDCSRGSGS